jgi:hypothetical protein
MDGPQGQVMAPTGMTGNLPGAMPPGTTVPNTSGMTQPGTMEPMPPAMEMPPAEMPPDPGSAGAGMPPPSFDGPENGDPNAPVVELADPACGGAGGFGLGSANYELGGRGFIVDYPCGKHEGARMTFILNLHGTTPLDLHFYQHNYFAAHQFMDSHNLIVITPSSVVQQWGNMDNGEDRPHLMAIIDWVYTAFSKFQITSMWVAGHSWGAFFAKTFVCDPEIMDKARGVVAQAGGARNPACIDRVSHIHTIGELDMGGVLPDQSAAATAHGCDAMITGPEMVGNNRHRYHANCDPGWVHSDYFMLGKMHADAIDREVVQSIVEEIKATEVP